MKILALNFTVKGIGTYQRAFYFSRELARAGHDITLATVSRSSRFRTVVSYKRDWLTEAGAPRGAGPWVRLIEGPFFGNGLLPGTGWGPLDISRRFRELAFNRYDAVLGFEYQPNVSLPVYLSQSWRNYAFYSDWCDWFGGSSNSFRGWKFAHRLDSYWEEQIRYRAERVSVTSRVLEDRALSIGIPREKIVRVPQGAQTDYIRPLDRTEARRRFRIPQDASIVVAVSNGTMCREIRIFREVLRRAPGAIFLWIGNLSRAALALAEELGITDRVAPTGWITDEAYPWALSCADVCICPLVDGLNDRARWPSKILDFLAAGRATVTNPVGEVEPLFRSHEVGVLADHLDESFAHQIVSLFRDSDRRHALGELARKVMLRDWDWQVRGPQIAGLLAST